MKYPYQNPTLSVEQRVEDLLARMTLEEKFTQMRLIKIEKKYANQVPFDMTFLEQNRHRLGAIYNSTSTPPESIRAIQEWIVKNTRLGIPAIIHGETLHGFMHENATVFPQSIGLGATFNRELMTRVVTQIGKEARSGGAHLAYAPNVDLSRDPRWGRVEENYGEDPYLTAEMGVAYVKTLQAQGVAACPKHFIAHGSPEGGLNMAPVHTGERELRETMMIPFQKVIREGKAKAIMPAYSEWDGIPVHASRKLLTGLLREEMGFEGHVVSDYGAIAMLHNCHRVARDYKQAGRMALYAGVDVEARHAMGFSPELEEAVRNGEIPMEWVDQAVSRILRTKFELGLFENPYPAAEIASQTRSRDALALCREAAQESFVLLKNEGDLLPLSEKIGKIALIGPNADMPQMGDYTVHEALAHGVSLRQALEERLGKERVLYAQGCSIGSGTREMLEEAVKAAEAADAVVMVVGDSSYFYDGIKWGDHPPDGKVAVTCGETFDVSSLELPGQQQGLIEAVYAVGKPVILVLETGRPYAICWAKENIPAIVQAWYPGEQGGHALAELLFGDFSPSGRLPISFPRSAGHVPVFYNYKLSARGRCNAPGAPGNPGRDYVFDSPEVLYSFGDGLAYTTFAYKDLTVKQTGKTDAAVTVTVKNTGHRASFEVVQLYISQMYCRVTPFVRQLRGFEKIWLEPGQEKTVAFTLGFEDFAFVNEEMKPEVEPGEFVIRIGDQKASLFLT